MRELPGQDRGRRTTNKTPVLPNATPLSLISRHGEVCLLRDFLLASPYRSVGFSERFFDYEEDRGNHFIRLSEITRTITFPRVESPQTAHLVLLSTHYSAAETFAVRYGAFPYDKRALFS